MARKSIHLLLLLVIIVILIWSYIRPNQLSTWYLEVIPLLIALVLLIVTYWKFTFSTYTYVLLFISAVFIAIGGHYTYEKVPIFDWIKDYFHLKRNHYDRFVHFFQGFTAATVMWELILRTSVLKKGIWVFFIVISFSLSFSALYEIGEFVAFLIKGKSVNAFLGMQGDRWDTQWDMVCNLTGATISAILLSMCDKKLLNQIGTSRHMK